MKLHPIFVHFPIGLFTIAFILEIIEFATKDRFKNSAFLLLFFSFLFSIVAVQTGNVDAQNLIFSKEAEEIFILHRDSANLFLVTSAAIFMFKLYILLKFKSPSPRLLLILLGLYLVGLLFVFRAAYFGMKLVFEHGVGLKLN
ncbi:MAG: DUF2231 domain-containing protein [Candidatus Kryptonium sp.]